MPLQKVGLQVTDLQPRQLQRGGTRALRSVAQRRGFTHRRTKTMRIYEGLELSQAAYRRFSDREADAHELDRF